MSEKEQKTIYEMDKDELKTYKEELKSTNNTLQTDINNFSVRVVFGEVLSVPMKLNGENTTVEDFITTDEFENAVENAVENYGVLCSHLFSKNGVNDEMIKRMVKNIGISKKVFWNTIWKKVKIQVNENRLEQIEKREAFLKKEEEKERKVGQK